jgi:glycerophosphoryl diester phosphodiesterase
VRVRTAGRPLLIGHRGAAGLAPENTLEALACAVELGVDLVEFDVLALGDGTLVLAHSDDLVEVTHGRRRGRIGGLGLEELRAIAPSLPTLDDALAFLAQSARQPGAHVDLKARGLEADVADALRRHGLLARALISSCERGSLCAVAAAEPSLVRALTYPCDRVGLGRRAASPLRAAALAGVRSTLPRRIGGLLDRAGATVASLHHGVVTRAVVERCHAGGAAVFAWTVNDEDVLYRTITAGVDGVITDDPSILRATLTP